MAGKFDAYFAKRNDEVMAAADRGETEAVSDTDAEDLWSEVEGSVEAEAEAEAEAEVETEATADAEAAVEASPDDTDDTDDTEGSEATGPSIPEDWDGKLETLPVGVAPAELYEAMADVVAEMDAEITALREQRDLYRVRWRTGVVEDQDLQAEVATLRERVALLQKVADAVVADAEAEETALAAWKKANAALLAEGSAEEAYLKERLEAGVPRDKAATATREWAKAHAPVLADKVKRGLLDRLIQAGCPTEQAVTLAGKGRGEVNAVLALAEDGIRWDRMDKHRKVPKVREEVNLTSGPTLNRAPAGTQVDAEPVRGLSDFMARRRQRLG